jgi:hypothetical protein
VCRIISGSCPPSASDWRIDGSYGHNRHRRPALQRTTSQAVRGGNNRANEKDENDRKDDKLDGEGHGRFGGSRWCWPSVVLHLF